MCRKINIEDLTTPEEAWEFIDELFSEDIEGEREFIYQFKVLVRTAKSLSSQKSKGQLPTDGETKKELESLIDATNRYLKSINRLRANTKSLIDDEYIKDHINATKRLPKSIRRKVFIGEYTLPLKTDKSGKTSSTVHLGVLMEVLTKVKKYSESGQSKLSSKDASEFKKLEWDLARAYRDSGREITKYLISEFAKVLKTFHLCCSIEEYDSHKIDNKYISRIKTEANQKRNE